MLCHVYSVLFVADAMNCVPLTSRCSLIGKTFISTYTYVVCGCSAYAAHDDCYVLCL